MLARLIAPLLSLSASSGASASEGGLYVLPGREADVVRLLGVHWRSPPKPLVPRGAAVEKAVVRVRYVTSGSAQVALLLHHPRGVPPGASVLARAAGLNVLAECPACGSDVLAALQRIAEDIAKRYPTLSRPLWEAPPAVPPDPFDPRRRGGDWSEGARDQIARAWGPASFRVGFTATGAWLALFLALAVLCAWRVAGSPGVWAAMVLAVPIAFASTAAGSAGAVGSLYLCALVFSLGALALVVRSEVSPRARAVAGGFFLMCLAGCVVAFAMWPLMADVMAYRVRMAFLDGFWLLPAGLVFFGLVLRRVLRRDPPVYAYALTAIVIGGLFVRVGLSERALTEAWATARLIPMATRIFEGEGLLHLLAQTGGVLSVDDLNFAMGRLFGALAPAALYLHARLCLRDGLAALLAALLVAFLPLHVRFSASDTYFTQSLVVGAFGFSLLYVYLTDESAVWRRAAFAGLCVVVSATFWLRPDNIVFYPVFLGTIFVIAGPGVPALRRAWATLAVTLAAAHDLVGNLLVSYARDVSEGLSWDTVSRAFHLFFDVKMNLLINPEVTPILVMALTLAGLAALLAAGARKVALYLVLWLGFFFGAHAYVIPAEMTMQARYYMHLVSPLVLLAACSVRFLSGWPRWAQLMLVGALVTAPANHAPFIQDVRFNHQREFDFLEALRPSLPAGCVVIDYGGPYDCTNGSVFQRIGQQRPGRNRWEVERFLGASARDGSPARRGGVAHVLAALRSRSSPCVFYYEGLRCQAVEGTPPLAPACEQMRRALSLTPLHSVRFPSRVYDPSAARACPGVGKSRHRIREDVELVLYRVDGVRPAAASAR